MDHVDEIFSFTGKVRFDRACFTGGKKGVVSEAIGNVWASGAVFTATIGAGRELWVGISLLRAPVCKNNRMLLKLGTGNGERESGNECTAVIPIKN